MSNPTAITMPTPLEALIQEKDVEIAALRLALKNTVLYARRAERRLALWPFSYHQMEESRKLIGHILRIGTEAL